MKEIGLFGETIKFVTALTLIKRVKQKTEIDPYLRTYFWFTF